MNKTLAAYATRSGSTAEIAKRIGETLSTRSFAVDVKPVDAVFDWNKIRRWAEGIH